MTDSDLKRAGGFFVSQNGLPLLPFQIVCRDGQFPPERGPMLRAILLRTDKSAFPPSGAR